jgi:hypothetical protein
VSGGVASIVEWWQTNNNGSKPSPALVKASIINTADDMGTRDIPNNNEGWGRLNLTTLLNPQAEMEFEDQTIFLRTGNISSYDYYIASSDYPLKITLAWTDPAAGLLANPTLINNLDLKVTSPDNTTIYYGNVFSNGISTSGTSNASSSWDVDSDGFDERNNVECVFIPHTDVQVGVYKVQIIADNVGTDAVSSTPQVDQDFALVISGDLSEPNDVGIDSVEAPKSHQKNKQVSIKSTIKNFGINNQTSPFNVRCIIKNPKGSELVNNTKIVSSLGSFESVNRIWNFTPTTEGQHSILIRTELFNDDNNANNKTIKYLMVPFIMTEIATYTGVSDGDRFGWNVSFAGDLNGDGHSDVIIGAPYNDTPTGSLSDAGAAYIFYGPKSGNYSAASADIIIYGTSADDHFGWDVAGLGDINGTYDDVIIGAPGNDTSVPGKAYIFTGWNIKNDLDGILQASQADTTIIGETNGDRFGCSVAGAGDVNNASNRDIIVGAFLNDNNGLTDNGRAYLFFGDGTISTSAGNADSIFNGTLDNEYFGFSVSCSGDMDGDDIDDVIIGAPGANNKSGRSYLIGGFVVIPSGSVTYNFTSGVGKDKWFYHKNTGNDDPPSTGPDITGESELTSYSTIAISDNIRTPLHPDSENAASSNNYNRHHFKFIINEPKNSVTSLTVLWEGYDTGATSNLYIWNVSSSTWDSVGTGSSRSTDNIIQKIYSSDAGNYISTTGRLDFGVTAKDGSKALWRYLFTDFVNVEIQHDPYIGSSFKTKLIGEADGDSFGWAVNSSGDVNDDGYNDVVIGAPGHEKNRGRAYVVYGRGTFPDEIPASSANVILSVGESGDKFGYSVGSVYFGTDGFSDILVGAPYNNTMDGSITDAGAVYVFNGSDSMPGIIEAANYTRSGEYSNDHLGWAVANAFDMNNDDFDDIIVGAPHYDNSSIADVGKVYIFTNIPEYPVMAIPLIFVALGMLAIKRRWRKILLN